MLNWGTLGINQLNIKFSNVAQPKLIGIVYHHTTLYITQKTKNFMFFFLRNVTNQQFTNSLNALIIIQKKGSPLLKTLKQ